MNQPPKLDQILERVAKLKKEHRLDLSSDEDLSLAVMNLVSLEEHFFFTGAKTGQARYYDLLAKVREIRKELMKKVVKDAAGEVWCVSKHLLAASMRLIEVGAKYQSQGKKKAAQSLFSRAYDLYSLFWGLNLKLATAGEVKKSQRLRAEIAGLPAGGDRRLMNRLNNLVEKLVNCCEE